MKNEILFNQTFMYDETSPTGLRYRKNKNPAGKKVTNPDGYEHYTVTLKRNNKYYCWSLPRVLFEIYHDVSLSPTLCIKFLDGDRDNLKISNLSVIPSSSKRISG